MRHKGAMAKVPSYPLLVHVPRGREYPDLVVGKIHLHLLDPSPLPLRAHGGFAASLPETGRQQGHVKRRVERAVGHGGLEAIWGRGRICARTRRWWGRVLVARGRLAPGTGAPPLERKRRPLCFPSPERHRDRAGHSRHEHLVAVAGAARRPPTLPGARLDRVGPARRRVG